MWVACGWKTCVDSTTFFSGLRAHLDIPQLVTRGAKVAIVHLTTIKQRWSEIQPLLEMGIDVGDAEADGQTHSDGILDYHLMFIKNIIFLKNFAVLILNRHNRNKRV